MARAPNTHFWCLNFYGNTCHSYTSPCMCVCVFVYWFGINLLVNGHFKTLLVNACQSHVLKNLSLFSFFLIFEEMELFPASLATAHSHVFTRFHQLITSSTVKHISTLHLSHSSRYMPMPKTYYIRQNNIFLYCSRYEICRAQGYILSTKKIRWPTKLQ
jgi:hypothetical protein